MCVTSLKYVLNLVASIVADEMSSLRSGRYLHISLSRPSRTSVCMVRSCASSIIMTEYCLRSGSVKNSRRSIPSVMYLTTVVSFVQSSKRIEYPTSCPSFTFISSATRAATLIAATRRGWVHPSFNVPPRVYPSSCRYCMICVVCSKQERTRENQCTLTNKQKKQKG